jgi:SAM-dependent methyltransferase
VPRLPLPTRSERSEILDDPGADSANLARNLRDIRRLNRLLGGTSIAVAHLGALLPRGGDATILDAATGSADIPLAMVQWGKPLGIDLRFTALDSSEEVLRVAQVHVGDAVRLIHGDARRLPFADCSFDVVTCCLALHHFQPDEAIQVLGELWRTARRGVLVVDLVRSYPAWLGTWLACHLLAQSAWTRHDGPLSVLRAYTPAELRHLAMRAGMPHGIVVKQALFRQVLIARKDARDA